MFTLTVFQHVVMFRIVIKIKTFCLFNIIHTAKKICIMFRKVSFILAFLSFYINIK